MSTKFVRLPWNLQRPITGGCQCPYCQAHPTRTPKWDALAFSETASWVVHMPELKQVLLERKEA